MSKRLVLISGKTTTGKSASLRNIKDPEGVLYMGAEGGKDLPFASQFKEVIITDPYQVFQLFDLAEQKQECHTLVIDSITYLMDMFETQYVLASDDTRKAWGDYAQYFKKLIQEKVAKSTKNVIMTAHTDTILNDQENFMETKVPIKGALKNQGIESYFSCIVSTKRVSLDKLKDFQNENLHITEEDIQNGYKYVFQTRTTKETINERIRNPMGMWAFNETYIDNDVQILIDRLEKYYGK